MVEWGGHMAASYRVDTIAMGVETNLVYQKDKKEMIKKSWNINAWGF